MVKLALKTINLSSPVDGASEDSRQRNFLYRWSSDPDHARWHDRDPRPHHSKLWLVQIYLRQTHPRWHPFNYSNHDKAKPHLATQALQRRPPSPLLCNHNLQSASLVAHVLLVLSIHKCSIEELCQRLYKWQSNGARYVPLMTYSRWDLMLL